jgi:hypothetical protein
MGYLTHLGIYLDQDTTPIAGYITTEREKWRPFHGWLELSSAIEAQRTGGPRTANPSDWANGPQTANVGIAFPQAPSPAPRRRARASGTSTGDTDTATEQRRIAACLAQRTGPTWMLVGAWSCACWNAIAVVAFATTGDTQLLAWWGLGLLATLVLLTFIWTEQRSSLDSGDGDPPLPGEPPTSPQNTGRHQGEHQTRSHVLERRATGLGHNSPPHRKR